MKQTLLILTLLFSVFFNNLNAQLCLGEDTTVCVGQPVTITNCNPVGGSNGNGLYLNSPTNVSLLDDVWSSSVPIGFPFSFYGTTYNNCVIGSNGLVSFDLSKAGGYCAWSLGAVGTLPSTSLFDAKTSAMGCYQDMNPGLGGTIQYQTIGTAPNRIFVVLYKEIPMFSCGSCSYLAIMLYETSNKVEFHIGNKPPCTSWNGGLAIQGNENSTGLAAVTTPGRNNTQWSANQDGKRFSPTSPTNTSTYTVTTIPYVLATSTGTNLQWQNTLGQTFPYNNGILNVNSVPPGTTGYFLSGSACGTGIGSVSDTTWITRVNSTVTATSTTDYCNSGVGSVTAAPGVGIAPFTFNWPTLGQTTQTVNNVLTGTYLVQMVDGNGCPSSANVIVPNTNATYNSTSTIVNCAGESTGTATANMNPPLGTITYLWNDPLDQTTQTATGLASGVYTCNIVSSVGCNGTTTVTVNEVPAIIFDSLIGVDVTCNLNDGQIYIYGNGGTQPYTYYIDGVQSLNDTILNLSGGNYLIGLQDINGCSIDSTIYIDSPTVVLPSLVSDFTRLCIPGEFTFTNTSTPVANVASSYITFGDGLDTTVLGVNGFSHTYPNVGEWDITIEVTSDYGCQYVQTYTDFVETSPLPVAQFVISPNPTTMFETTVTMQDQSTTNIVDWSWSLPGSSQISSNYSNPTVTYPDGQVGEYMVYLTVIDDLGCTDTVSHKLIVLSDVLTYIPNAFTPDGDELNQVWKFNFAGIEEDGFNMYVFNRWGQIIWESHDVNSYWDGTFNGVQVQQGSYVWKADFDVLNTAERRVISGMVTILK